MHDLDRTMFGESAYETGEFLEVLGELTGEQESQSYESENGQTGELLEMELASELLEITNEAELDRFIGKLVSRAVRGARAFARSSTGRALGGVLKDAAKRALPIVGRGVGGLVSPRGGDIGARVGTAAADIFGLELEGLSAEDREFEVARSFVRFGVAAARKAAQASRRAGPASAVQQAVADAARDFAPGLLPALGGGGVGARPGQNGRWVRRGGTVVLFGA